MTLPRTILYWLLLLVASPGAAWCADTASSLQTGHALLDQWQVTEAEALAQSLLKAEPNSGDAHFLQARVLFLKGQYEQAWKILQPVSDRHRAVAEFKTLLDQTRKAVSGFVTEESAHFVFRYADGPDRILVHYATEVLERSYEVLGDLFGVRPREKVRVEFYPNREPFAKISPLTMKDIVTSGTVALCKYNRLMMISPGSLVRGYNWMDTLSHEYIHFLLALKGKNAVPLWLNEGIAKFYEARWRGAASLEPLQQTVLARGLQKNHLIALEDMMPSLAKLKNAEDVQLAYAQVATMVEYLAALKGDGAIAEMVGDLAHDLPFADILKNRWDLTPQTLQAQWRTAMQSKNLIVIPGLKVLETRFKESRAEAETGKDYGEIEEKPAQDLAFLGDVLKSRNYPEAAVIEYQKAVQETRSLSPILHNKLAGAYLTVKEYGKAEALLQDNLKFYPMFTTTLTHLGETYFLMDKPEEARRYFEQAVRVNPFNPFVHQRLIELHRKLGDPKQAEAQTRLYRRLE
jgi:tetratricopeptide (TPR) repeat protein